MARNRAATTARIIETTANCLASGGYDGFGVNAVASAAGIDKVLLYRYFGGLDGLLERVAAEFLSFPDPSEVASVPIALKAFAEHPLAHQLFRWAHLRNDPLTKQFIRQRRRWERQLPGTLSPAEVRTALLDTPASGNPRQTAHAGPSSDESPATRKRTRASTRKRSSSRQPVPAPETDTVTMSVPVEPQSGSELPPELL